MTGFAQLAFANKANGSLISKDGTVVGSRLAAQAFTSPHYFHPRPSATAPAYNAGATTFANLGPTNPDLAKAVQERVTAILKLEQPYNTGLDRSADDPRRRRDDVRIGHRPAHLARERRHAVAHASQRCATSRSRPFSASSTSRHRQAVTRLPRRAGVNVLELNLALDKETGQ